MQNSSPAPMFCTAEQGTCDGNQYSSDLGLESLQDRRNKLKLIIFYKTIIKKLEGLTDEAMQYHIS